MGAPMSTPERDPLDRYYTPAWVADLTTRRVAQLIASWSFTRKIRRVMCPAVGDGAFLVASLKAFPGCEVTAYDADPESIHGLVRRVAEDLPGQVGSDRRWSWHHAEFPAQVPDEPVDLVIDNPPNNRMHTFIRDSASSRFRAFFLPLSTIETRTMQDDPPRWVGLVPRVTFGGPAMAGKTPLPYPKPYAMFLWDRLRPEGPIEVEHLRREVPHA